MKKICPNPICDERLYLRSSANVANPIFYHPFSKFCLLSHVTETFARMENIVDESQVESALDEEEREPGVDALPVRVRGTLTEKNGYPF